MNNKTEQPLPQGSADSEAGAGQDSDLGSTFIPALRAVFLDPPVPSRPWPSFSPNDREKALAQMTAVFRALFLRLERRKAMPKAARKSALALVAKVVKQVGWKAGSPVPAEWSQAPKVFQRWEIAQAMDILLHAFNGDGGGGAPRDWPPPTNP